MLFLVRHQSRIIQISVPSFRLARALFRRRRRLTRAAWKIRQIDVRRQSPTDDNWTQAEEEDEASWVFASEERNKLATATDLLLTNNQRCGGGGITKG